MKKSCLCLIPAKGCSTRLPRKNMLPLGGHPLIAHSVRKAITSDLFDVVCVSTEDQEIATIASSYGADVPFIRPDYLARDPATIEDVMLHALDYYNAEGIIFHELFVILPTTPFVTVQDLLKAQEFFRASGADALLSVTPTDFPPFNAWLIHHEKDYQRLTPCFPESPINQPKFFSSICSLIIS